MNDIFIALLRAAFAGVECLSEFIQRHPDAVRWRNEIGETALHYLAIENQFDLVDLLLENGSDPKVGNKSGRTLLYELQLLGLDEMHSRILCAIEMHRKGPEPLRDRNEQTRTTFNAVDGAVRVTCSHDPAAEREQNVNADTGLQ